MSNFRTECRNAWVRMVVLVRDESARARVRSIASTRKKKKQRKTTETNRNQRAHARKQKPSVVRGLNFRFISYRVRPIRKNWILVLFIYFFRYKKRKTFCNPVGFTFLLSLSQLWKTRSFHFLYFLFVCVCCSTKKFTVLFFHTLFTLSLTCCWW